MKKQYVIVVLCVLVVGIISAAVYAKNTHMSEKKMTREEIVKMYCPSLISFYKNEEGEIGFFGVTPSSGDGRPMDLPVSWYDTDGNELGSTHIFGDQARNDAIMSTINELMKEYPVLEQHDCGAQQ